VTDCYRVVRIDNKNIEDDKVDVLYHFGLNTISHDLRQMFSDVKVSDIGQGQGHLYVFDFVLNRNIASKG